MKRLLIAGLMLLAATASQAQVAFRPLTSYSITISSTGNSSAQQIGAQSRIARVICSVSCHVAFPLTTIASALSYPMVLPPFEVQYIKVSPRAYAYVISTASGSGSLGTLYITEVE